MAMKKIVLFSLIMAFMLSLWGCMPADVEETHLPTTEPTTSVIATTEAVELTTEPEHSPLYLPDYRFEQIWEYFEEVVFHMEYTDGTGDATLVQKWCAPLYYYIYGDPTDEDLAVLENLFEQLNGIDGFPGIHAAETWEDANLSISFLDADAFVADFSECINGEDAYGAAQFWYYTDTNEIYTARIGYRTDLDQTTRTSILLEEIVNMLGITDTLLREDSIVYQHSNDNMELSDVDWTILKLLYSTEVYCGMNAEGCRFAIQDLYY